MATSIGLNAQNAMVTAMAGALSGGSLVVYSGAVPANAKAALSSNTVLATFTLNGFGTASNGVCTANAITSATSSGTGTATFVRVLVSGTAQYQCDVGGGVINFIDSFSVV